MDPAKSDLDKQPLSRNLIQAKRSIQYAMGTVLFLPILSILIGIKSISPRADLPVEGCTSGCATWLWASIIPFALGLNAISCYRLALAFSITNQDDSIKPPKWIYTIGNIFCMVFGLLLSILFLMIVFSFGIAIYHVAYEKPAHVSYISTWPFLVLWQSCLGMVFTFFSVIGLRHIYKKQFNV